jgi:hypothetical protein
MKALRTLGFLTAGIALLAQAPRPAFDVATIKRNVSLSQNSSQRNMPGGRINFTNQRLRAVIRAAYGGIDIEVVGGPGWIDDDAGHRRRACRHGRRRTVARDA